VSYGWLGAKQRATDATGLMLMGVRLYNPRTGLFTSVDPVSGGGSTAYAYPTDPINQTDLTGERWRRRWRKAFRFAWRASTAYVGHARWRHRYSTFSVGGCAVIC
jgi:RHS repeat-associated protein